MRKRKLGETGMEVSEIAFGGVEIGLPYGIGVTSEAEMLSETAAIELLRAALAAGINFFDTARLYGASEQLMGKAFRDCREQVVLCTKCRPLRDASGNIFPDLQLKDRIEKSLQESLSALQTDYVDIFMLHQADPEILGNAVINEVFSALKKAGTIRATGLSTYTIDDSRLAVQSGGWDVIQLPYNMLDQRQEAVFSEAANRGVGLVVRSVLMKGLLSSRGRNLHPALSAVEKHIVGYREMLNEDLLDLPTLAIRFALSRPEIASVLVGMDRMAYLNEALAAADGEYLSAAQREALRQRAYPEPDFLDLHHWDLMGWLR